MQWETVLLMRPGEAAVALGIGRSKVYELISTGELPTVRIGRSVRIPVEGLRIWISERTQYENKTDSANCRCQLTARVQSVFH